MVGVATTAPATILVIPACRTVQEGLSATEYSEIDLKPLVNSGGFNIVRTGRQFVLEPTDKSMIRATPCTDRS
jgi:hypothetical protein